MKPKLLTAALCSILGYTMLLITSCGGCPANSEVIGKPDACVDACMADRNSLCGADATCRNKLLDCHRLTQCKFDAIVAPTSSGGYSKAYTRTEMNSMMRGLDCATKDELGIEARDATATLPGNLTLVRVNNDGGPDPRFTPHGYSIPFLQSLFETYPVKDGVFTIYRANKRDVVGGPLNSTFALKYSDVRGTLYYLGDLTDILPSYFVK